MTLFQAAHCRVQHADSSAPVPTLRHGNHTPAAIYLRMSTEHQQYSLENQLRLIQRYAHDHGFIVVQTYTDAAKSGVLLRNRSGLRQLLQDVMSSAVTYKAILVYDISRWGRFQDIDESAHYEFVCKSSGVPVHYCAETFLNDGTLTSLMMKALKRTMAGEYSRELSKKVFDGQKRLAQLGFKQGGVPGYGLRRMLMSANRVPKQVLQDGERKSIATDRVILIPGPREEVQQVRNLSHADIGKALRLFHRDLIKPARHSLLGSFQMGLPCCKQHPYSSEILRVSCLWTHLPEALWTDEKTASDGMDDDAGSL